MDKNKLTNEIKEFGDLVCGNWMFPKEVQMLVIFGSQWLLRRLLVIKDNWYRVQSQREEASYRFQEQFVEAEVQLVLEDQEIWSLWEESELEIISFRYRKWADMDLQWAEVQDWVWVLEAVVVVRHLIRSVQWSQWGCAEVFQIWFRVVGTSVLSAGFSLCLT